MPKKATRPRKPKPQPEPPAPTPPVLTTRETEFLRRRIVTRLRQAADLAVDRMLDLMLNSESESLSWDIISTILHELEALSPASNSKQPALPPPSTPPTTLIQMFASASGLSGTIDPLAPKPLDNFIRQANTLAEAHDSPEDDPLADPSAGERTLIKEITKNGDQPKEDEEPST